MKHNPMGMFLVAEDPIPKRFEGSEDKVQGSKNTSDWESRLLQERGLQIDLHLKHVQILG